MTPIYKLRENTTTILFNIKLSNLIVSRGKYLEQDIGIIKKSKTLYINGMTADHLEVIKFIDVQDYCIMKAIDDIVFIPAYKARQHKNRTGVSLA